jgi:hypothetical protein
MYDKLSKKELRIIEQTKREGEELENSAPPSEKGKSTAWVRIRPLLLFVVFFFLMAFIFRIVLSLTA